MAAAAAVAGHFVDIRHWQQDDSFTAAAPPSPRRPKRKRTRHAPFTKHTGLVALMDRSNVDTDQIIPKQFLKRIERTGFGEFLFFDWRYRDDGTDNPDFELNQPRYRVAQHPRCAEKLRLRLQPRARPWALGQYGFRAILAESFADIFFNNCFKNGMLPIRLGEPLIDDLFTRVAASPGCELTVDLQTTHDHRPRRTKNPV